MCSVTALRGTVVLLPHWVPLAPPARARHCRVDNTWVSKGGFCLCLPTPCVRVCLLVLSPYRSCYTSGMSGWGEVLVEERRGGREWEREVKEGDGPLSHKEETIVNCWKTSSFGEVFLPGLSRTAKESLRDCTPDFNWLRVPFGRAKVCLKTFYFYFYFISFVVRETLLKHIPLFVICIFWTANRNGSLDTGTEIIIKLWRNNIVLPDDAPIRSNMI